MQLHLQYVVVVKMRFQCVLLRSQDERVEIFSPSFDVGTRAQWGQLTACWAKVIYFQKGKTSLSQQTPKGSHTYAHSHTLKRRHMHIQMNMSMPMYAHPTLAELHTYTRSTKSLNSLITGTPLRKQQSNYHHILYQGHLMMAGSYSSIHFTCTDHILPSYKAIMP